MLHKPKYPHISKRIPNLFAVFLEATHQNKNVQPPEKHCYTKIKYNLFNFEQSIARNSVVNSRRFYNSKDMKKIINAALLLHAVALLSFYSSAQVSVGTGTVTSQSIPIEPYFGYSYTQSIYLASEINASGSITGLTFYTDPSISISSSNDWTLFIGHTTKSSFASSSSWESGLTEVFNGSISVVANEVTITFTTPFNYNGTDNLIVSVDENQANYDNSTDEFLCTGVGANRALSYANDNNNPDPLNPPTATYTRQSIPNIQFLGITQTCPVPSAFAANNVTATSANLAWTENGSATNWAVEYGTAGFTPGTGTTAITTTNPHALTGLTPSTSYEYYVRSICGPGDSSAWVGPFSFTTQCVSFTAPFAEPFATASLPNCWSQGGNTPWEYGSNATTPTGFANYGAANVPDHSIGGGGTFIGMDGSDNEDTEASDLTSPLIDISGLSTPQLSYWVFSNNTSDGALNQLLVQFYNGTTWSTIETIQANLGTDWVEFTTDLSTLSVSGDVQVRFTVTGDGSGGETYNNDILIDDVQVRETPTCFNPSALMTSNITSTAADISWTVGNPSQLGWEISIVDAGTPAVGGTPSATNTYNATGLASNTNYDVYVREICSVGDTTAWLGPISFATLCGVYTAPFTEPFATNSLPACWSQGGDNPWEYGSDASTPSGFAAYGAENAPDHTSGGGGTFIGMDGSDNDDGKVSDLTTPLIDISGLTDPQLSYWVFSNNTNDGALNQLVVEVYNGSAWSTVQTIQTNLGVNWVEFITDLSTLSVSGDIQVRFTVTGDGSGGSTFYNDILIDDVTIDEAPACPNPSTLTVSNIAGTSLDFGWTENGSATTWNVEYGPTGFSPTGTPTTSVTSNPASITGLTPQTGYDFYLQADCGTGSTSIWIGPFTVTTTCATYTPDYTEDFSSYIPNCWEETDGLLTSSSTFTTTISAWLSEPFGNTGSNASASINLYDTDQDEWLISPSIDLTGGPFQLEYDVALTAYASTQATTMDADDSLAVVISTDNGATWSNTNILTVYTAGSEPATTGQHEYIDLSAYSGVVKFGFYAKSSVSGVDNDLFIDNFEVTDLCIPATSVDTQVACETFTWIDGNTYTASNNSATHTIVGGAANGCDSIVTLNLTINTPTTGTDVQTACNSFTWIDGNTYTASNNSATYTITGGAANGCDSTVTLNLTINTPTTGTDVQTACNSFTWIDGNTYTASNNSATHTIAGGAANGCDSTVTLNLTINMSATGTDVQTACQSFTWIDGNTYTASNNSATHTIAGGAANGCDSVVTLDLTINGPDVSVAITDLTITVGEAGATYQWIDCDNNNTPITGETGQSFTATANGNYAVEVTNANCTSTSTCTAITTVATQEISAFENISIYPNPVKNQVNISFGNINVDGVSLLDVNGKTLFNEENIENDVYQFEMHQSPGIYFIKICSNERVELFKIVKE